MTNFLTLNTDGSLQEIKAITVSSGAASSGAIPALNAAGQLDSSMIPATGGGPSKGFVVAMAVAMG